jgi:hypothetical protein
MIRPTAATLLFGTVVLAGGAVAAFNLSSKPNAGIVDDPAASSPTINRRDFVARSASAAAAAAAVLPGAAVAAADDAADPYSDYATSESGMRYLITKEGDGAVPSAGQLVKVRPFFRCVRIDGHNRMTSSLARNIFPSVRILGFIVIITPPDYSSLLDPRHLPVPPLPSLLTVTNVANIYNRNIGALHRLARRFRFSEEV